MTTIQLLGCDGSTWNLMGSGQPQSVVLANGIGGLHLPKVRHLWSQSARRAGSTWRGSRVDSREFTVNLVVLDPASDPLIWQALSTDELSTLVANGERSLSFRLDEDNEFIFEKDPRISYPAVYPVACVADQPYWLGAKQAELFTFETATDTNYYGGDAGLGPPFVISAGTLFESAAVANPGDLEAWPVWTISGPASTFRVGVGDHVIQPPFALRTGDIVIIDSEAESITDSQGNDLWPLMGYGPVDFAPLPPGALVPLSIGMDDPDLGASIAVSVTPRYRRAWGVGADVPLVVPGGGDGGVDAGFGLSSFGTGPFGGVG